MSALDLMIVDAAGVPVPDTGRVMVYVGAGGVLRVKAETGQDIPLTGATGAKGATGAAGALGQAGAAGAAGAQGVAGPAGAVGAAGAAGAQGVAGPAGAVGAAGAAGAQGVAGPAGAVGATGAAGAQGVAGPAGAVGAAGAAGAQGVAGPAGQGAKRFSVSEVVLSTSGSTAVTLIKSVAVAAGDFVIGATVASLFATFQTNGANPGMIQLAFRVNGGAWTNFAQIAYAAGNGVITIADGAMWVVAGGYPLAAMRCANSTGAVFVSQNQGGTPINVACTLDFGASASSVTTWFGCRSLSGQW